MSATNVDEVLEIIGFGCTQFIMLCTCGCISVFIMNEIMGITVMAVAIACEFALSDIERSFLTNAGFLGMIVFGHYTGYTTDLIGRRRMILYSVGSSLITSIISVAMPKFYMYLLLRFMVGSFITGASTSNFAYIIEYTAVRIRPHIVTFTGYFLALGYIYAPCLAHFIGSMKCVLFSVGSFDIRLWRLSVLLNTAPGVLAFIAMFILPESAKYLLSVGKSEKAFNILNGLCKKNRGQDLQSFGVTSITQPNLRSDFEGQERKCFLLQVWLETIPLFKPPFRRPILLLMMVMSGNFFVGTGLGSWFMQLRQRMPDVSETVCQMLDNHWLDMKSGNFTAASCWDTPVDYIDGVLFGCIVLGVYILISIALIWLNRKIIMLSLLLVATFCGFVLNFINQKLFILCAFICFITLCTCCIPLVANIVCDVVPTHIR
ncbi:uncharacterized protein Dwil_GK12592 [Drosophila willistoni]|uniref:Major facilitator superfamily (MFS) profile domain-containing protein n=2 Tax=Drosophila willistoni TaxID=7260 RepID=B4N2Z4_DROWI|nr:uncharacterized protein Dwil_GK12592 [Drosophila willistoni]